MLGRKKGLIARCRHAEGTFVREPPPDRLVERLERLGLATRRDLHRVRGRVKRLARDLPVLEPVWIDALVQARKLTPFQAAEINAGRSEQLVRGPYVLESPVAGGNFDRIYRAVHRETRQAVRLVVVPLSEPLTDSQRQRLVSLSERTQAAPETVLPLLAFGEHQSEVWLAYPWQPGRTAADWLIHHGRFPPQAALEIARQLAAVLIALAADGCLHTDLAPSRLVLARDGSVRLCETGLRGIFRQQEGAALADLPPPAYDHLPPERVIEGSPPDVASELYACGLLWWHLVTGRPPHGGGNALTRLRAAQAARIPSVRRLAYDVPEELAGAIEACLQRDLQHRPASFVELSDRLGPPQQVDQKFLAHCVRSWSRPSPALTRAVEKQKRPRGPIVWAPLSAALLVALSLGYYFFWPETWRQAARAKQPVAGQQTAPPAADLAPEREPTGDPKQPVASFAAGRPLLELPAGAVLEWSALELEREMVVRGDPLERPRIRLRDSGGTIDVEQTRFEHVDFVWEAGDKTASPALLAVRALTAEFVGCSFQSTDAEHAVAIRWSREAAADDLLPTGRIGLTNCVFSQVEAVVDAELPAGIVLDLRGTLHVGDGPLLRLRHAPRADQPVRITLRNATLRECGPLLECHYAETDEARGRLSIETVDCVLALGSEAALVTLVGSQPPTELLKAIRWTGQGSVLSPQSPLAVWKDLAGQRHTAREEEVRVEGLVRGDIRFAGPVAQGPSASRATDWQAPRRSPDPPGIGQAVLHLPRVRQ